MSRRSSSVHRQSNRGTANSRRRRQLGVEKLDERCVLSTISGVAFNDANGDGVHQVGVEEGIAGFTVFHETDGNSILDNVHSEVTAANGSYSLSVPDTGPSGNHYASIIIPAGDATGRWLNTTNIYQRTVIYAGQSVSVTMNFGFRFVPYAGNFTPLGGETLVNQTIAGQQGASYGSYSDASSIAADSAGNYVVAWVSPAANLQDQVYMRVFNADGSARTNETLVATANRKTGALPKMPVVAMSDDGSRFAVSWNAYGAGTNTIAPFVRTYNASGTAVGTVKQVSPYSTKEQYGVTGIAMDGNGDFAVLMTGGTISKNSSNPGITQFQRFTNAGAATGNRVQVVDTVLANGEQGIAMDGAGNFVVVWAETTGIFAQRYSPSGSKLGSVITVVLSTSAGADREPSVAMNSSGRFVVSWNSGYYTGLLPVVVARVFDAADEYRGGGTVAFGTTHGAPSPGTDIDALGNVTVAWGVSARSPDGSGTAPQFDAKEIRVRRLSAGGTLSDPMVVNTTTEGSQHLPSVAATGTNGFVVAWNGRGVGDDSGIFTQRYSTSAPSSSAESDAALMDYLQSESNRNRKTAEAENT